MIALKFAFKVLAFFVLASGSHAYEFVSPACKAKNDWTPLFGKCNAEGLLSGPGAALYLNLITRGEFKSGLPDGKHDFYFGHSHDVSNIRSVANSEVTDWSAFVKKYPFETRRSSGLLSECTLTFTNGVVAAKEVTCHIYTAPDAGYYKSSFLDYTILPFDGKIRLVTDQRGGGGLFGRDLVAKLVADVPKVSVTAQSNSKRGGQQGQYSIKGNADNVEISELLTINGIVGESSFTPERGVADKTTGYFVVQCVVVDGCREKTMAFAPTGGAVDVRYLITKSRGGKTYQYVPLKGQFVYYFKSADGLEFDGSVGNCGGEGKARLVVSSSQFDIIPICGKVTSSDGKSFTGRFDSDGRPLTN